MVAWAKEVDDGPWQQATVLLFGWNEEEEAVVEIQWWWCPDPMVVQAELGLQ